MAVPKAVTLALQGRFVELCGLQRAPEKNGVRGIVHGPQTDNGRWPIKLGDGKCLAVNRCNFKLLHDNEGLGMTGGDEDELVVWESTSESANFLRSLQRRFVRFDGGSRPMETPNDGGRALLDLEEKQDEYLCDGDTGKLHIVSLQTGDDWVRHYKDAASRDFIISLLGGPRCTSVNLADPRHDDRLYVDRSRGPEVQLWWELHEASKSMRIVNPDQFGHFDYLDSKTGMLRSIPAAKSVISLEGQWLAALIPGIEIPPACILMTADLWIVNIKTGSRVIDTPLHEVLQSPSVLTDCSKWRMIADGEMLFLGFFVKPYDPWGLPGNVKHGDTSLTVFVLSGLTGELLFKQRYEGVRFVRACALHSGLIAVGSGAKYQQDVHFVDVKTMTRRPLLRLTSTWVKSIELTKLKLVTFEVSDPGDVQVVKVRRIDTHECVQQLHFRNTIQQIAIRPHLLRMQIPEMKLLIIAAAIADSKGQHKTEDWLTPLGVHINLSSLGLKLAWESSQLVSLYERHLLALSAVQRAFNSIKGQIGFGHIRDITWSFIRNPHVLVIHSAPDNASLHGSIQSFSLQTGRALRNDPYQRKPDLFISKTLFRGPCVCQCYVDCSKGFRVIQRINGFSVIANPLHGCLRAIHLRWLVSKGQPHARLQCFETSGENDSHINILHRDGDIVSFIAGAVAVSINRGWAALPCSSEHDINKDAIKILSLQSGECLWEHNFGYHGIGTLLAHDELLIFYDDVSNFGTHDPGSLIVYNVKGWDLELCSSVKMQSRFQKVLSFDAQGNTLASVVVRSEFSKCGTGCIELRRWNAIHDLDGKPQYVFRGHFRDVVLVDDLVIAIRAGESDNPSVPGPLDKIVIFSCVPPFAQLQCLQVAGVMYGIGVWHSSEQPRFDDISSPRNTPKELEAQSSLVSSEIDSWPPGDSPAKVDPEEATHIDDELWATNVEKRIASEREASQPENKAASTTQEADNQSVRRIVLLSFNRHPSGFDQAILSSPLACSLKEQGYDPQPPWACGAKFLVAILQDELPEELHVHLHPMHVFVSEEDEDQVHAALSQLSWTQRPTVKKGTGRIEMEMPKENSITYFQDISPPSSPGRQAEHDVNESSFHAASSVEPVFPHFFKIPDHCIRRTFIDFPAKLPCTPRTSQTA